MTCSKCKHNFCWICLADWDMKAYKCLGNCGKGIWGGDEDKNASQSKHDLDKYLACYEKYHNHDRSGKLAREMKEKLKE